MALTFYLPPAVSWLLYVLFVLDKVTRGLELQVSITEVLFPYIVITQRRRLVVFSTFTVHSRPHELRSGIFTHVSYIFLARIHVALSVSDRAQHDSRKVPMNPNQA